MKYFYIVDKLKTVRDNAHLLRDWEACGTVNPDVSEDRQGKSEVLVQVRHRDNSTADTWENLPGVSPLPDPLDTTEISDEHMNKLQRFHPYRQQNGAWVDTSQTPPRPLTTKPHTRMLLNEHVSKMFPSFKFRLFN